MRKTSVSIPEEMYRCIEDEARKKGISISEVIRTRLEQKKQIGSLREMVIDEYSDVLPGLEENLIGAILIDVDEEKLLQVLGCKSLADIFKSDMEEEE